MTFQILWNVVSVCYLFIYLFVRLRFSEMGVNGKGGSIGEIHFISEYPTEGKKNGKKTWKEPTAPKMLVVHSTTCMSHMFLNLASCC